MDIKKYEPLLSKFPKLKGILNIFEDLKQILISKKDPQVVELCKNPKNVITFDEYTNHLVRLHSDIVQKYNLLFGLFYDKKLTKKIIKIYREECPEVCDYLENFFLMKQI